MGNDMMEAYLFEMNTLLEQVDEIVLSAEKNGSFSEDEVNEIFRIMHTIKGSSAMMEFSSLMTVAHRIEDLFFIIREKTIDVVPESRQSISSAARSKRSKTASPLLMISTISSKR